MPEPLDIEISFSAKSWLEKLPQVENLCHQAAQAAWAMAGPDGLGGAEVSIVLADDRQGQRLNRDYRGHDKPTNVLSFANLERHDLAAAGGPGPVLLGDIVISCGVTCAEAEAEGKSLADHLSHLVVHGMLHLLSHDHGSDDDARVMEKLERRILGGLGVEDPYDGELQHHVKGAAAS